MRQKSNLDPGVVRDACPPTSGGQPGKHHAAEEKDPAIVLDVACAARDLNRRAFAGAKASPRACADFWSKEFLEAGKRRLLENGR